MLGGVEVRVIEWPFGVCLSVRADDREMWSPVLVFELEDRERATRVAFAATAVDTADLEVCDTEDLSVVVTEDLAASDPHGG